MDDSNQSALLTDVAARNLDNSGAFTEKAHWELVIPSGLFRAPIALVRVSCRGVLSQAKRCRVRNTTDTATEADRVRVLCPLDGGGLRGTKGLAALVSTPVRFPGNGWVIDPNMPATSRSYVRRAFQPMTVQAISKFPS